MTAPQGSSLATVIDTTGLVTAVTRLPSPGLPDDGLVEALPDDRLINVSWLGGACDLTTLTLTGTADTMDLRLVVLQGAGTPPGTECPAIGLGHGVSLTMAAPIQAESVSLSVR